MEYWQARGYRSTGPEASPFWAFVNGGRQDGNTTYPPRHARREQPHGCWPMRPRRRKNAVLARMAGALEAAWPELARANALDVSEAEKAAAAGALKSSLVERLRLSEDKLRQMVKSVREVEALPDPVGQVRLHTLLDDGLELKQVTFPFGVVAAIVEARPDAVVQLAALALKSGNALMIKAGAEAARTSQCVVDAMAGAMAEEGITGRGADFGRGPRSRAPTAAPG